MSAPANDKAARRLRSLERLLAHVRELLSLDFGFVLWDGATVPADLPPDALAIVFADEGVVAAIVRRPNADKLLNLWVTARIWVADGPGWTVNGRSRRSSGHKVALLEVDGQKVTYTKRDLAVGLWPYNLDITPDGKLALTADNGNAAVPTGTWTPCRSSTWKQARCAGERSSRSCKEQPMTDHPDRTVVKAELDRLTADFFRAVSFEEGEFPPYEIIYGLFIEAGLLIKNTAATPEISTVTAFIAPRQAMVRSGELSRFNEVELCESTEIFGNVAHRLNSYAKSGTMKGVPFTARGMISTQFVQTPAGWKISAMAWDDERPGLSIPTQYEPAIAQGSQVR